MTIPFSLGALSVAFSPSTEGEKLPADVQKAWQLVHCLPKDKCLSEAKAALAKNPNSADWLEVMALCLLARNDLSALKYADKALSLRPSSARIMTTCALLSLRWGNQKRALRLASRAIKIDPLNGRALAILGTCYYHLGEKDEATESFSRALECDPSDYDVNELAIKFYESTLSARSVECAERLVQSFPNSPQAYFERGHLRRQLEHPSAGLGDYAKAIALDPNFKDARYYRAKLEQRLDLDKEAIVDFDKVVAISPPEASLYARRATSLEKVGQLERALADLNAAIKLSNPPSQRNEHIFVPERNRASSKEYIGWWLRRMDIESRLGYQELALGDATEILKVDHACDSALSARQSLLVKKGRYLDAIRDLTKLIELNPDVGDWYEARAEVYQKLNKPKEAADDFAKAKHIEEFGK